MREEGVLSSIKMSLILKAAELRNVAPGQFFTKLNDVNLP